MINGGDIIEQVLMFKGFWSSPFKDKLKWLFIAFPFFACIVGIAIIRNTIYGILGMFRRRK
jgi:hypothetical protein